MSAIVVYDATCHGPRTPLNLELPGLTSAWRLGSAAYRATGRFQHVIGACGWRQALDALLDTNGATAIDELQLWCHGKWGQVFLGREVLDVAALAPNSALAPALDRLRETLAGPQALVWFRTCETFGGSAGRRFAEAIATRLGCRVAGHTYIIGPFQSGLHALAPGEHAGWADTEGLLEGTADNPRRAAWSSPGAPRTISCLHSSLPPWAHDAAARG